MYKKRLHVWQARKYYSQDQKIGIMEKLLLETASEGRCLTVNRKPLNVSRILRSVRNNGRDMTLVPQADISRKHIITQNFRESKPGIQNTCLSPSESVPLCLDSCHSKGIAKIHRAVQQYYTWYASRTQMEHLAGLPHELIHPINFLIDGRASLQTQLQSAFGRLNQFCLRIWPVVASQPFHLLGELVSEFIQEKWQSHRALCLTLLQYLQSMAFQVHGKQHPISIIITTLLVDGDSGCCASTFYGMLLDTISSVLDRCQEEYFQIHLSAICSLIEIGSLTTAETLCLRITREVATQFPRSHPLTRRANGLMASLRYWQRDLPGAERILLEEIEVAIGTSGAANGDGQGIFTCGGLAIVYLLQERHDESEAFACLASSGGLHRGDPEWCSVSSGDFENMKRSLLRHPRGHQGMASDLAQIQDVHSHVWKKIEAWTIR